MTDKMSKDSDSTPDIASLGKYKRGDNIKTKKIKDKKLKETLKNAQKKTYESAKAAKDAEVLKIEDEGLIQTSGMEKSVKLTQKDILESVDGYTLKKSFELKLEPFGPYSIDYTYNGSNLLLAGQKGHVATFDWRTGHFYGEIQLKETVFDCKWLHNETMYALAQKKYVYIYDRSGMEVHCLKKHSEILKMDYLRYHFLLATISATGYLHYIDTSTGENVADFKTRMGKCDVITQNPWNAVINLGHNNGVVSMWTPNLNKPVVKMLSHRGPVTAMAVEKDGNYMTTAGLDGRVNVWDLRKYEKLHSYHTCSTVKSLSISQKGLLAVGHGPHVSIWKDALSRKQPHPYMKHLQASSSIAELSFCPFEDILGVGHSKGFNSLIIPGAGEANYDAFEANPYQNTKQRQEAEVKALLDKLPADSITLDPGNFGKVDPVHQNVINEDKKALIAAKPKYSKEKNRARGRNSASSKFLRKQQAFEDAKKEAAKENVKGNVETLPTLQEKPTSDKGDEFYSLSKFKVHKSKN